MAKYAAAEASIRALDQAIQCHGGNGLAADYGLAMLLGAARHRPGRTRQPGDDPELRRPAFARPPKSY